MSNKELNTARSRVYQLLSSLFAREIDQSLAQELNSQPAQNFLYQLASEAQFKDDITTMLETFSNLQTENQLLELAADYCGLFLVDGKHSASAYAGSYLENKGNTLFGKLHQQLKLYLEQNQLQLHSDFKEPADHIAVILAYCGYLCTSADEYDQKSFLQIYVTSWLEKFVHQVEVCDQGLFYSALARFTLSWLNSEVTALSVE